MKSVDEIKNIILFNKPYLNSYFGINYLAIFGSFASNDTHINSDLDLLYTLSTENESLFKITLLENYLSNILKIKVDLVPKKFIKQDLRKQIYKNIIRII